MSKNGVPRLEAGKEMSEKRFYFAREKIFNDYCS